MPYTSSVTEPATGDGGTHNTVLIFNQNKWEKDAIDELEIYIFFLLVSFLSLERSNRT